MSDAGLDDSATRPLHLLSNGFAAVFALAIVLLSEGIGQADAANLVPGTTCPVFPSDNWWHADVSRLPVHPRSANWISHMSPTRYLHPDFGPSYGAQPAPYGIPITIVDGSHPRVTVKFNYAAESDRIGYPVGSDTRVEGGQWKSGDRHTIVVNRDTCRLYETWYTRRSASGGWLAGSGATWALISDHLRPAGWTSADAAGLPILPGLLRFEEVSGRTIDHAVRFTTDITDSSFIWPARHQAGSVSSSAYPPMGARFRLKASYAVSASLRADTRAVLAAMKKYGLVLADNGSPWFFQGTADTRWSGPLISELKSVPASAFEAVDTTALMISIDSMKVVPAP